MKKLVFMAALMLAAVGAYAQHEIGSINIQPKVGLNLATVSDAPKDAEMKLGLAAGVEAEYQVTDLLSITLGAMYSQQGYKMKDDKFQMDYVNVPVMANVYVVSGLAVKLGVQPGFQIGNKFKEGSAKAIDLKGGKKFDISIPVGVSYEYSNFQIDARYNWGLTKLNEVGKYKNDVFQVTLCYKIQL